MQSEAGPQSLLSGRQVGAELVDIGHVAKVHGELRAGDVLLLGADFCSLAETLRMIHNAFRHEFTLIRKEVVGIGTTATPGAQLRINCLKLCQGLHYHHTGESIGLFPALLDQHPEAAATITRLQAEHDSIATPPRPWSPSPPPRRRLTSAPSSTA